MEHFKTISDLFKYMGAPAPENPLFGLVQFNCSIDVLKNKEVSHDFYVICLKKLRVVSSGMEKQSMTAIKALCISFDRDKSLLFTML